MPNFAYTNNTQFRPFSFEEQLKPLLMYTQAHQAVEEAYSELDSQANAIGSLANEANDPITYARYKSFEASLRNQADTLAKNGLTPGSRKSLLDLRGRYAKEITPIQNAITRRRELADEQRKALLQNPTLMFQRDMNSLSYDSSLDRFLENPDYDYGQQYSGALLTQQVSQAASNLAKELLKDNYGNGKRLDAYTKTFLQKYGFTSSQVLDAINNPNRATSQPVLNAIVEQVIGSSGMSNWADTPTMNKAYSYARQGLWSAIGQDKVSPYEDYGARLQGQLDLARAKKGLDKPNAGFAPRIIEGVQGEIDKNVKRMEGLRVTPTGVSTAALDKKYSTLEKAQSAYNNFMKGRSQKDYSTYEQYQNMVGKKAKMVAGNSDVRAALMSTSANYSQPEGYSEYIKLKSNLQKAQSDYDSELTFLNEMNEKYRHLGKNIYERLYIGSKLSDLQEKEEKTSFSFNARESDYQNARKGIANILGTVSKEAFESGTVGLVDKDGEVLDYDDTKKILDKNNIENLGIKITGGRKNELKITYDGEEYSLKGIEQINNFNKSLQLVNDYLKDFSQDILSSVTEITPKQMKEIEENGIASIRPYDMNIVQVGSNYYGTVLHDSSTGEYIKVLIDKTGNIVAANSLSDELSGGETRDSYFINMANRGFESLIPLVAQDYE